MALTPTPLASPTPSSDAIIPLRVQWGGFCAYGVSGYDGNNYLKKITQLWSVPADVNQFSIIDSKLYLFRGAGAKELFEADLDTNVEGGNGMWEGWFGDCTGFFNTECFM